MKIAVTGASGHLGNVLCRFLLASGHEVNGLCRNDLAALHDVAIHRYTGDVLDKASLDLLFDGCEIVFHCAAKISIHGDPDGSVKAINTEGVKHVIACAISNKVRKIIHVSSVHAVVEEPKDQPFTENRPYKSPKDFAYDASKAAGEQLMLEAFHSNQIEGCIVRPSSIVGPFDYKPSELGKALLDFKHGKIPVIPPGGYDFVDVRCVAEAMVKAIDNGRNGEVYLLTGKYHSLKSLFQLAHEITGAKIPKISLPFWLMRMALPFVKLYGKIRKSAPLFSIESISALKNGHPNMDSTKAVNELDLVSLPLKDTLRDFYAWQENHVKL